MHRFCASIFVLLLFLQPCFAESKIDPAKFKELLVHHVTNVPELTEFWGGSEKRPLTYAVSLSGGVLRGLIRFLRKEVEQNGWYKAWNVRIPSADRLLIQKDADWDVVAAQGFHKFAEKELGDDWDVLSEAFHTESLKSGGATIEKVTVGPRGVLDPYQAIRDYLNGKLSLYFGPQLDGENLVGNTRLAQSLRFLRMAADFPEAKITSESWKVLHGVQWETIQRNSYVDYWILKALGKLYRSLRQNNEEFLEMLHQAKLLKLLAHHHFSLPVEEVNLLNSGKVLDFHEILAGVAKKWPLEEQVAAAEILPSTAKMRRVLLEMVKEAHRNRKGEIDHKVASLIDFRIHYGKWVEQNHGKNTLRHYLDEGRWDMDPVAISITASQLFERYVNEQLQPWFVKTVGNMLDAADETEQRKVIEILQKYPEDMQLRKVWYQSKTAKKYPEFLSSEIKRAEKQSGFLSMLGTEVLSDPAWAEHPELLREFYETYKAGAKRDQRNFWHAWITAMHVILEKREWRKVLGATKDWDIIDVTQKFDGGLLGGRNCKAGAREVTAPRSRGSK